MGCHTDVEILVILYTQTPTRLVVLVRVFLLQGGGFTNNWAGCNHIIIISKLCHPKKLSATKLGRKVDSFLLLRKIFENPRTHTGLGEYLEWAIGEEEQFYHNVIWR